MAAVAQGVEYVEEPRAVGGGEGGGRLVEHDELGAGGEGAGDGDERALGGAEAGDPGVGVQVPGDDPQGLVAALPGPPPGDQSAAAGVAGAQGDVLGHRHPRDEPEVLVDEGHVPGCGMAAEGMAGHRDLARVGPVHPGEHLDEGGLSGSVGAEQGEDAAAPDVEVDRVQREGAAEPLAQAAQADEWCGTGRRGWARPGVGSVMHRLLRGSASEFFPTVRGTLRGHGGSFPA